MSKECLKLIGFKMGMTQIYDNLKNLIPVTLVKLEDHYISQVKSMIKDKYNGIQLCTREKREKLIKNPIKGHLSKINKKGMSVLKESRVLTIENFKLGEKITTNEIFKEGNFVNIIGKTKGKGFQGVVKRWNFSGGPDSHGSMSHRRGGSYGQCQFPGEIAKGKKMPGHTGNKFRTVKNLLILKILKKENILLLKGSIPGFNGNQLEIVNSK